MTIIPSAQAVNSLRNQGLPVTCESLLAELQQQGMDDAAALAEITRLNHFLHVESKTENDADLAVERHPSFISAAAFLDTDVLVEYLVKPLLERDTVGQFFGPWSSGKSFVALDLACGVATGGQFGGSTCEKGIVLYLAGEGHGGLKRRVKAWAQQNGKSAQNMALLHLSTHTITFDGSGLGNVIEEAKEIESHHQAKLALIIIDTQARHMVGNESGAEDGSKFIRSVDAVRAAFPGSVVLIVHHSGYSEDAANRGRGTSVVPAACDFIAKVNDGLLTFTKQKESEIPAPLEFKLTPCEIGRDNDGEPITSCTVHWGERSAKHRNQGLTVNEKIIVEALTISGGEAETESLRDDYYSLRRAKDSNVKTNTIKNAWHSSFKSLIAKGVISETDGKAILQRGSPTESTVSQRQKPSENDGAGIGRDRQKRHLSLKGDDDLTPHLTHDDDEPIVDIFLTDSEGQS